MKPRFLVRVLPPRLNVAEVPHQLAEQQVAPNDKCEKHITEDDHQEKNLAWPCLAHPFSPFSGPLSQGQESSNGLSPLGPGWGEGRCLNSKPAEKKAPNHWFWTRSLLMIASFDMAGSVISPSLNGSKRVVYFQLRVRSRFSG